MPLTRLGRAILAATAALAATGSVAARAVEEVGSQAVPRRSSAYEARYRAVRHAPPRYARRSAPPDLIHAYLPRYTEAPLYNEPPNRFPQR